MFTYDHIFKEKKNILIVTAHPDDSLVYFGALINKLRKDSKNVYVVVVTNGARGSGDKQISEDDLSKQRIEEEAQALAFLKVSKTNFTCLQYKDGEAVMDAVYPFARDASFFPEHAKEGIEPHTMYDILLTDEITCTFDFDYTEDLETKKAAMRMHKSQFDEEFITDVVETVKSGDRYLEKFFYVKLQW